MWDRLPGSKSSNSPGSGRGRCARCCSPTWVPRCCASTGRAAAISGSRGRCATTCCCAAAGLSRSTSNPRTGKALALRLVERADGLIEGFRPGVTERLGLGPDDCLARNPRLVYGRVTGWGQNGPLAQAAGHDINYISLAGALHAFGRRGQPPTPPLNLLGDFAGGSLYLAFGLVCGILEARRSGQGQIVDAAMIDGAASLMTAAVGAVAAGLSTHERGTNTSIPAHISTTSTNAPTAAGSRSRRSRASSTPNYCAASTSTRRRCRRKWTARAGPGHRPVRRAVQDPHPRPMVRLARRDRCLFRAGADHRRSPRSPAQRRAADLCRDRRHRPAGPGAALFANGSRPADPAAASSPEQADAALAAWLDPAEIAALKAAGTLR